MATRKNAAKKTVAKKTTAKKTARKAPAKRTYTRKKAETAQVEVNVMGDISGINLDNAATPSVEPQGFTYDDLQRAKRVAVEDARNGILGAEYAHANRLQHPVQLHALTQLSEALLAGEAAQKALDKAKREEQAARLIALAHVPAGIYSLNGFVFTVRSAGPDGPTGLTISRLGGADADQIWP